MSEKSHELEFSKELTINTTPIPGLLILDLPVHGDNRGWFKENWNNAKMSALGLPEFNPVQNNISFNADAGVTRGIHAEPWDKFISVGSGKIFGAWVDLREGDSFGSIFTAELDPTKAIFVPRGVGNSFQALEDDTVYSYLVNDHWSAEAQSQYTFLNLADETADIDWPIPLTQASLSDKDLAHPRLQDVTPMKPKRTLITGSDGQLGKALRVVFPDAEFTTRADLDITDKNIYTARNWRQYDTIINAAAYTDVDGAETPEGRRLSWEINARAVANLGKIATQYDIKLVQPSSEYVFDGSTSPHSEDEPSSPISVYGQTKAAGDIAASAVPKHYIVRTSWVVGEGKNFVNTMKSRAETGAKSSVVNDQIGRLTFASDLARAIKHLLEHSPSSNSQLPIANYGTYNVSSDGDNVSWADVAADVYELTGHNRDDVTGITTDEYYASKIGTAQRPLQSTLNLDKIKATGFVPRDWREALAEYLDK